ncbi:MAG: hypothetical protein Q7K34_03935 [archaeon]|nr:hypothetical protein [archaeon]
MGLRRRMGDFFKYNAMRAKTLSGIKRIAGFGTATQAMRIMGRCHIDLSFSGRGKTLVEKKPQMTIEFQHNGTKILKITTKENEVVLESPKRQFEGAKNVLFQIHPNTSGPDVAVLFRKEFNSSDEKSFREAFREATENAVKVFRSFKGASR